MKALMKEAALVWLLQTPRAPFSSFYKALSRAIEIGFLGY
jgi:hypothetical protein